MAQTVAYADSASDLPMLEAAGVPVAVNAEAKLAAIARKRGWHTEHWAKAPGAPVRTLPIGPLLGNSRGPRRHRPGPPPVRAPGRPAAARPPRHGAAASAPPWREIRANRRICCKTSLISATPVPHGANFAPRPTGLGLDDHVARVPDRAP